MRALDALIAIGGEDTLGVAHRLHAEHGAPVIGVPKTIDNDLAATDQTFGFDTAVSIATEAIDRLHTTAESHDRVMVVEVMGRHAGWLAVQSGIAGGADVVLIPEFPITVERCADMVRARHAPRPRLLDRRGRPRAGRSPTRPAPRVSRRRRPSSTRSATSASAASATGWREELKRLTGLRHRASRSSATCSAAARRPRTTACWRRATACSPPISPAAAAPA